MSLDELRERGEQVRRNLLGSDAIDKLDSDLYTDDWVMERFRDLCEEIVFGVTWSREGLDLKTRSLVTMVSDVATGEQDALSLHVRFCRRFGYTEEEIVEVILHLMSYVGVPLARRALITCKQVFADIRAEEAAGGTPLA